MDIDGIVIGFRFHSPYFIHELDAGEYLARIGEEFIQQIEFLSGQGLAVTVPGHGKGIIVQDHITDHDFSFAGDLSTAQQSLDAQDHFLLIHRFCHIVICSHNKSFAFVFGKLLGGDHQNGQVII